MATFVKRGGNWNAQVARRGVRKSATFPTKREAQDWARSVEAEIVGGTASTVVAVVKGSSGLTIGALIDRYVEAVKPAKRWGRTKDFSLAAIKARLGDVCISDLTSDVLVDFAQKRAAEGAGPVTVQMDLAYIGSVLKVARVVWRLPIGRDLVADAREALKLLGLVGKSRQRSRIAKPGEIEAVSAHWASAVPFKIVHFAIGPEPEVCRIMIAPACCIGRSARWKPGCCSADLVHRKGLALCIVVADECRDVGAQGRDAAVASPPIRGAR